MNHSEPCPTGRPVPKIDPVIPIAPLPQAACGSDEEIAREYADLLHRPHISEDGLYDGILKAITKAKSSACGSGEEKELGDETRRTHTDSHLQETGDTERLNWVEYHHADLVRRNVFANQCDYYIGYFWDSRPLWLKLIEFPFRLVGIIRYDPLREIPMDEMTAEIWKKGGRDL